MPDIHNHSVFSPDSLTRTEDMILSAIDCGLKYFAITEHVDFDDEETDVAAYAELGQKLKRKYARKINFAVGLEFGYADSFDFKVLQNIEDSYPIDLVINSVHRDALINLRKIDKGFSVCDAYNKYLEAVYRSLDAKYHYDVVGHLGYIARYCTRCKNIVYNDYKEIIDKILNKIIDYDKTLELNSAVGGADGLFLPHESVAKRYIDLGGRNFSFGSDAHQVPVARKYKETVQWLKTNGIDSLDFFVNHQREKVKI